MRVAASRSEGNYELTFEDESEVEILRPRKARGQDDSDFGMWARFVAKALT